MSSQPLYRIVYADGKRGYARSWLTTLMLIRRALRYVRTVDWADPSDRPVRVERVSPAPRATGGGR